MLLAARATSHSAARTRSFFLACAAFHLTACNAIFGIRPGETDASTGGTGGATSSTGTGATGASSTGGTGASSTGGTGGTGASPTTGGGGSCDPYSGHASITWVDADSCNLPAVTFEIEDSIDALYDPDTGNTVLSSSGYPPDPFCYAGIEIHLAGVPVADHVYTLVDRATFEDLSAFHAGENAFVSTYGRPAPAGMGCDAMPPAPDRRFDSTNDMGQVKVVTFEGKQIAVQVSNVIAFPNPDPQFDGEGTLELFAVATSYCYSNGQ